VNSAITQPAKPKNLYYNSHEKVREYSIMKKITIISMAFVGMIITGSTIAQDCSFKVNCTTTNFKVTAGFNYSVSIPQQINYVKCDEFGNCVFSDSKGECNPNLKSAIKKDYINQIMQAAMSQNQGKIEKCPAK
jgi:hypothetical protein